MIDIFETARWRSCFIGGIAVQRWSEPRLTRDVDLTLLAGFGQEDVFIDTLLAAYRARIGDAKDFARRHRVLLLGTPQGVGIYISLGALAFEESVVRRASIFTFGPGLDIRTCSAEGVVIRHKDQLDWHYIEEQLRPLAEAKEDPEILYTLQRLRLY